MFFPILLFQIPVLFNFSKFHLFNFIYFLILSHIFFLTNVFLTVFHVKIFQFSLFQIKFSTPPRGNFPLKWRINALLLVYMNVSVILIGQFVRQERVRMRSVKTQFKKNAISYLGLKTTNLKKKFICKNEWKNIVFKKFNIF